MTSRITIYRNAVYAGEGRINTDGEIVDCPAVLGPDQDSSDETYEAIEDYLNLEPQEEGRYVLRGEIDRPDGVYSWEVDYVSEEERAAVERALLHAVDDVGSYRNPDGSYFVPLADNEEGEGEETRVWIAGKLPERWVIEWSGEGNCDPFTGENESFANVYRTLGP